MNLFVCLAFDSILELAAEITNKKGTVVKYAYKVNQMPSAVLPLKGGSKVEVCIFLKITVSPDV